MNTRRHSKIAGKPNDKMPWNGESLRKLSGFHQSFSKNQTICATVFTSLNWQIPKK